MAKIIQFSEIPIHGIVRLCFDGESLGDEYIDFPIVRATYLYSDGTLDVHYYNSWENRSAYDLRTDHTLNKSGLEGDGYRSDVYDEFDQAMLDELIRCYDRKKYSLAEFIWRTAMRCQHHGVYIHPEVMSYLESHKHYMSDEDVEDWNKGKI